MTYHASTGTTCFGEAMQSMKKGQAVRRVGWEAGRHILLDHEGICHVFPNGAVRQWVPLQRDLIAEDWKEHYIHKVKA